MRTRASLGLGLLLVGSSLACVFAACGGSGDTGQGGSASTTTVGTSSHGSGAAGVGGTGGVFVGSGGAEPCGSPADCDGGVCTNGVCCDKAENVCNGQCCTGGAVCLFDKCVVPGKACHTANDCAPGQYCETGLGDSPDGGPPDAGADGGLCTQPLPLEGKCLDLPPICVGDAGSDGGCVEKCDYHPPPGNLNAVAKWTWGPNVQVKPGFVDVWSTPTVGRIYDSNCDGKVDELDSPNVVFVSGKGINQNTGLGTCCQCNGTVPTSCHTGVLRMVDGRTGQDIWSLDKASPQSSGFAGFSTAIGDVDGDGRMDIIAVTGEGFVVMVDSMGSVVRTSDKPIPGNAGASFGWGGGVAIADMDNDGFPEIAFGATVFSTTNNAITLLWTGAAGIGGGSVAEALSTFVDLDGKADNHLELLAGNVAYDAKGMMLWNRNDLPDGFSGVGDFNLDGKPDAVLVANGKLWILEGATGVTELGPLAIPGTGSGGPPTVADFDGDGKPEIGVAMATFYSMMKPDYAGNKIDVVWQVPNHDLSSSVTGSSVFDFEGDGKAEVVYGDECFLWVFDGATGAVRFAAPHTSFTATEASLVADIDGDGHAEMLMVTNSADPSAAGWGCMDVNGQPVTINGVTWTPGPDVGKSYRGIVAFGDAASSWVGTRTLWTEHTYHVSNVCDDRDTACDLPNVYGSIPKTEKKNWVLPWLNNFRQNVQDKGVFDAPDAVVDLSVKCSSPVPARIAVRNIGLASLPLGVDVAVYKKVMSGDVQVGHTTTTHALFAGQTESIDLLLDPTATKSDVFYAKIIVDPNNPKFHECRDDNDTSAEVKPDCVQ